MCPTPLLFLSSGPCDTRCLQVPSCHHHIWDDPGRLSRAQRHRVALCYHRRGPPPQEQELQAARGLQAHEPGTYTINLKSWLISNVCIVKAALSGLKTNSTCFDWSSALKMLWFLFSSRSTRSCWRELLSRTRWKSSSACSTSWSRRASPQKTPSCRSSETSRLRSRWARGYTEKMFWHFYVLWIFWIDDT